MDKKLTFLSIGVIFWALAAVFMHFVGPVVFDTSGLHIIFWVANFFVPALFLPVVAKMTGRTKHDMLVPTVIMVIPAMTFDSLSITFDTFGKTHIYADTPVLAGLTGGFLIFAFVSFLLWALYWHKG